MGPSIFYRIKNARFGILKYLEKHKELKDKFENKGRYIAMYFNRLGATKQLAALPESFFEEEMQENLKLLTEYNPRNKSSEPDDLDE